MLMLFLLHLTANLIDPVAGIGGAIAGILCASHRFAAACVVLAITGVLLGFLTVSSAPHATLGIHTCLIAAKLGAMTLCGIFTAVLARLLPEYLPNLTGGDMSEAILDRIHFRTPKKRGS